MDKICVDYQLLFRSPLFVCSVLLLLLGRTINYVLTAGGLLLLSMYVKSSYKTTPKLHTSEATENLLSVRDSGAYLQDTIKAILFQAARLCSFEDNSFKTTDLFSS